MSNTDAARRRLLTHARFEILPTATIEDKVLASVPLDTTVTITASPAKPLDVTLATAERLRAAGYAVVPHLAARMIHGRSELGEIVDRLTAARIDSIFVPGGDATPEEGCYHSAADLLDDLATMTHPFSTIGVTGYPESHPTIHDDVTIQAMWDKRRHATQIVSNMTFDAAGTAKWVERVRKRGVGIPILIGLPGPVERTKLLTMGTKVGVGESLRFLNKQKGVFARIAAPGYSPESFLHKIARVAADPEMKVEGLHLFTFNQVAETQAWRDRLLAGGG
ncbi:MAG: methylenetetrahydrofolate reductase [Dermatophilaceae bacterium]